MKKWNCHIGLIYSDTIQHQIDFEITAETPKDAYIFAREQAKEIFSQNDDHTRLNISIWEKHFD